MDTLTLSKAIELYQILGEHIPDFDGYEDEALQFVGKIVDNIKESNRHSDYTDAVMLMSGMPWEEIKEMDYEDVLELFVSGLANNKIVQLKSFCDSVGFNHG